MRGGPAEHAIPLALPARSMRAVALFLAVAFFIFAAIDWMAIAGMFRHSVDDVFDLTFLLFQGFWALGWSVGVLLLAALTIAVASYSESAHLEGGTLVHVPRLGPLQILIDYDLANVRNVRLEPVSVSDPTTVTVRFDYDGVATALGNSMRREDGQRIVDAINAASRFVSTFGPASHRAIADTPNAPSTPTAPAAPAVSAFSLVAANLIPVAGVLVFGWDLKNIMLLYWVESGVIAFYTAIKIAMVARLAAIAAVPFFIGHFGGFMTAHFLLIYALFLGKTGWEPISVAGPLRAIFVPIWGSIAALVISHGISFYTNFVGAREYEGATVSGLMKAPYNRVLVMQLTLILGGWIILLIGRPAGAVVVLLLLKTAVDLSAHRKEHFKGR
jgi:hypothetical protein